jgi:LacI family transcriptional regulator
VRRHLRAYAESNVLPDAIFCHNDDAAIAAYRALCDIGAQVPGDVALIGCDGIEDTEYLATPLTTIAQPYEDLTKYAWQFLKRRIDEPDASPQEVTLNAALVIRESSGN